MDVKLSGHGTRELVPTADEIANVDPSLLRRAQNYLGNNACEALSPGVLKTIYSRDNMQPAEVSQAAATTVLYALHELGQVGPPDLSEAGSWAANWTLPDTSRNGTQIPQPRVSAE